MVYSIRRNFSFLKNNYNYFFNGRLIIPNRSLVIDPPKLFSFQEKNYFILRRIIATCNIINKLYFNRFIFRLYVPIEIFSDFMSLPAIIINSDYLMYGDTLDIHLDDRLNDGNNLILIPDLSEYDNLYNTNLYPGFIRTDNTVTINFIESDKESDNITIASYDNCSTLITIMDGC